jgi:hypothetical protein
MAYVEKFYGKWKDYSGVTHEIKLLQDGASAGTTDISTLGKTPVILKRRGSKEIQTKNVIIGSELQFNFISSQSNISTYDAIFNSEFKEWKVEFYINSSLEWTGWLKPDNYNRDFVENGQYFNISLSASDGLADLKKIEFKDFTTGAILQDRVTILTTVKRALEHTGINLDFRVQLGTYATNDSIMTSSELALSKLSVENGRLIKNKDGRSINDNCYKVIEEILKPLNVYLIQSGGKYWIVNPQEKNSYVFSVPWATPNSPTRDGSPTNQVVSMSGYKYRNRGEVQKIRPLERIESTVRSRSIGSPLLSNGNFDTPSTSEWSNVNDLSGTYQREAFDSIFNTIAHEGGYELQCKHEWAAHGTPTAPLGFIAAAAENLNGAEGNQLHVKFDVRCPTLTMDGGYTGGSTYEEVQVGCRLRKTSATGDVIISSGTGKVSMREGYDYVTVNHYFDITTEPNADYWIEFYVDKAPILWSDYALVDLRFDNIYASMIYAEGGSTQFDRFYAMDNADSAYTDIHEAELWFSDSPQDDDASSYKNAAGTVRTETWSRYGKSENAAIQNLFAQNLIENFAKYKNYARVTILDENNNIEPYSLPQIDSKDYQIVSHSMKYSAGRRKEIQAELVEVLNTAVGTTPSESPLTSADGVSTQSSSAVGQTVLGVVYDDDNVRSDATWTSSKINSELGDKADAADLNIANWDTAYTNTHTHSNKSVLDNITNAGSGSIITSSERSELHYHSNKSVLDGITSADVAIWDAAGSQWVAEGFNYYGNFKLGIGDFSSETITEPLHVYTGTGSVAALFDCHDSTGNGVIRVLAPTAGDAGIQFGDDVDENYGRIMYDNSTHDLLFYTQNSLRHYMNSTGIGVGVTPAVKLHVKSSATEKFRLEGNHTTGGNFMSFWDASARKAYVGFGSSSNESFIFANEESTGYFKWLTNGSERMRIDASGNVMIGKTSTSYKFDVSGTINGTGTIIAGTRIRINSSSTSYPLEVNGTCNATDYRSSSDIKFKMDIKPIENAPDILRELYGVSWLWKDKKKKGRGFGYIANDCVFEEAVDKGDEGLNLNYNYFIPLLGEGWKYHEKRIDELEAKIKRLEALLV